jgi:hypothetical protein
MMAEVPGLQGARSLTPNGGPHGRREFNGFQLVRFGGRWWLVGAAWDVESPGQTIPEEYLDD